MAEPMKHVRHGFGAVRPYIAGGLELIDFVMNVFDAKEIERHAYGPKSFHVAAKIGDSVIVLEAGEFPDDIKPWTTSTYVYVEDVDAAYARAMKLGGKSLAPPEDKPYQERQAVSSMRQATDGGSQPTSRLRDCG